MGSGGTGRYYKSSRQAAQPVANLQESGGKIERVQLSAGVLMDDKRNLYSRGKARFTLSLCVGCVFREECVCVCMYDHCLPSMR